MEHPCTPHTAHGTAGSPVAGPGRQDPPPEPGAPRPAALPGHPAGTDDAPAPARTQPSPARPEGRRSAPHTAAAPAVLPPAPAAHGRVPDPPPHAVPGPRPGRGTPRARNTAEPPAAVRTHPPAGTGLAHGPGAAGAGAAPAPHARPACDDPSNGRLAHALTSGGQVRRISVRGQIVDALYAALAEGELVPGEVYSAPALGERFGVSATPVREAMQQLACDGAVEVVPNRGFRVVRRDSRELAELAEVRALIEVPVVLRLARRVPVARWADLRPLAEVARVPAECADRAGYAASDRAFHRALLGLAGNQQLVRTVDDLHRRAQWPRVTGPRSHRRAALLAHAAEHTALLDALTTRDLPRVEALLREHYGGPER